MRNKLIELLSENFVEFCNVDIIAGHAKIRAITFRADDFADYLIANGVTIAEDTNVLSNADRIRAMTDEELAELLNRVQRPCNFCQLAFWEGACTETLCDDAMMNWLKQPAKEET